MKIESPSNIIVGQDYLVPCIRGNFNKLIPVILPSHSDGKEHCLFEAPKHYHIDFRFIDNFTINAIYDTGQKVFYHKFKAIHDYMDSFSFVEESAFFFINRWYRKNKDSQLSNGFCAHKRAKVTNACGTCPAHGLKWDFSDGGLAKYSLPFYIMITENEIILPENPSGVITDNDDCSIFCHKEFEKPILVMIDSNFERYGKCSQKLNHKISSGDTLTLTTDKICSKE